MTRFFWLMSTLAFSTLVIAGCGAPAPEAAPTLTTEAESGAAGPRIEIPEGDANWECGHASALMGIQYRTEWELANGAIDQAAFDARVASLIDSWTYLPTGQSPVTDALRTAKAAAAAGIGPENPEFAAATQGLVTACDHAGSITIVSALPEMGG
ncbi:MAG: hypothetical protein ACO1N6_04520 [Microcella sp.]